MLAEDNIVSSRSIEKNLKEWGYKVILTKNGDDAWKTINNSNIRLAILDWEMPGMDGIQLCRKVREKYKKENTKYIYIILITGRNQQEDIIKGLSAGADDYMTKPFNFLELKVRLQNGKRIIKLEDSRIELANTDSLTKLWNRKKIFEFYLALKNDLGIYSLQPPSKIINFKPPGDIPGFEKLLNEKN